MFILYKQVDSSAPLLKMRGHLHFHVTRAFGNNFLRVHLFKLKAAFYSGYCNTYKRTHTYVNKHTHRAGFLLYDRKGAEVRIFFRGLAIPRMFYLLT